MILQNKSHTVLALTPVLSHLKLRAAGIFQPVPTAGSDHKSLKEEKEGEEVSGEMLYPF